MFWKDYQIAQSDDGHELLSGEDMHAWAKVYFDGVGWLPVDVTPGYYYDTAELRTVIWKNL
ncbi:transglutaminase domain-containing protein [Dorea sp. AF24-7LB]|uniref:transglutaminase domain-containing protein n=1 Tax=Dorea sp. AF24-7LB TaxID=2293097 RepID=UPI002E8E57E1|nr:transglutaminase domain-containing protein [Dorea sp. AF24-7LB]